MRYVPFDEVFEDLTSKFYKIKKEDYESVGLYPIVDQGQQFIGGYTNKEKLISKVNLPVIIFGDHTKVFKFVDFPFTIGADGVKVLRLRDGRNNALFYFHYMRSLKLVDKGYSRHFKYLKDKKLPVFEYAYQHRIADILSRAESLIAQRKESIRLLDEYLKSTFFEMFGDPVRNERGWEVYTFEDFTTRVTKGESPKWQGYDYLHSGVRFVTSENVLWGDVDLEKAKYIHEDFHRKLKRSQLLEGDMLVNLVGASVGRTAMCPKNALPANINQAVAAITLKKGKVISSYVLFLFINQSFQRMMLGNVVEAARANLSLSDIRNLKIPVPPIELQTKFAKIVEKTEALKAQYHLSLQGLENLYGGLSQRAFRGDLVKIA